MNNNILSHKNVNRFNSNDENNNYSSSRNHLIENINIKIKSVNNKSIIGSFCPEDTLNDIFSFIYSNRDVLELPSNFGLRTNYPRRIYKKSERNSTLNSLGISSNQILIITELPSTSTFNIFSNEKIQSIKNAIGSFFWTALGYSNDSVNSNNSNINNNPKKDDDSKKFYNGNSTEYQ